jgi:ribosome recycling factor
VGEQIKVSLRNVRRDANKEIDKAEKQEGLSEDAAQGAKDEVQELLNTYENTVTELVEKKVKEVTTL